MPIFGDIAVALKPGLVNIAPVTNREYKAAIRGGRISGFHIKIDGCVGPCFVRSCATFIRSTDTSDVIPSYFGTTENRLACRRRLKSDPGAAARGSKFKCRRHSARSREAF
jgi:MspA